MQHSNSNMVWEIIGSADTRRLARMPLLEATKFHGVTVQEPLDHLFLAETHTKHTHSHFILEEMTIEYHIGRWKELCRIQWTTIQRQVQVRARTDQTKSTIYQKFQRMSVLNLKIIHGHWWAGLLLCN